MEHRPPGPSVHAHLRHQQRPDARCHAGDGVADAADGAAVGPRDVHVVGLEATGVQRHEAQHRGEEGRGEVHAAARPRQQLQAECGRQEAQAGEGPAAAQVRHARGLHALSKDGRGEDLDEHVHRVGQGEVQACVLGPEAEGLEVVGRRPAVHEVDGVVEGKVGQVDGPKAHVRQPRGEARRVGGLLPALLRVPRKHAREEDLLLQPAEAALLRPLRRVLRPGGAVGHGPDAVHH
mmetsp:Transcript_32883/g.78293  ORF Transcript_32883/g.78293 Transcript_32883/m.78293 type:complete len:235 (-) Transcript_32883:213-917(-)